MEVDFIMNKTCSADNTQMAEGVRKQLEQNMATLPCANHPSQQCVTQTSVSCVLPPAPSNGTRLRRSADVDSSKRVHVHFEMSGDLKDSNEMDQSE